MVSSLQLFGNVRIAGDCEQGREHIDVRDNAVQHRARLDLAWPAHEAWNAPAAFPVGVLLRAERRGRSIRPGVVLRAVVRGIHDDGVVGNAQLVEFVEYLADLLVVYNHSIAVGILAALAKILRGYVGAEVHRCRVVPEEERLVRLRLFLDKANRAGGDLLIDGLHALLGQRAGIFNLLFADLRPTEAHQSNRRYRSQSNAARLSVQTRP